MPRNPKDSTGKWTNLLHFGEDNFQRFPSVWLNDNANLRVDYRIPCVLGGACSGDTARTQALVSINNLFSSCGSYHIMIDMSKNKLKVTVETEDTVFTNHTMIDFPMPARRLVPAYRVDFLKCLFWTEK